MHVEVRPAAIIRMTLGHEDVDAILYQLKAQYGEVPYWQTYSEDGWQTMVQQWVRDQLEERIAEIKKTMPKENPEDYDDVPF